jgi:hypothetical protein
VPLPEFENVLVSDAGSKPRIRTVVKAAFLMIPVVTCISVASFYFFFSDNPRKIFIAILPLDNLTGSCDQAYLVDGIHDALIGELGKISSIRVISRTSTLRYPKSNLLLKDIARELDVNVIVEGSVNLLGFSYGAAVAYAAAGRETQQHPILRDVKGIVAVDQVLKYDATGEDNRKMSCAAAAEVLQQINNGVYRSNGGQVFGLFATLAASDADGASPLIRGFTNYQAALFVGNAGMQRR